MGEKEKIKVILDFIKNSMLALITALFGTFAFVVVNIEKINILQITFSIIGICLILVAIYFFARYFKKYLNMLGEIK